jgi:uroporphyrinogen decarboxylase
MRKPDPDFGRLRTALFGGVPDRVPRWDSVTKGFRFKFLGKKYPSGIQTECAFRLATGYDYVICRPRPEIDFTGGRKPQEGVRLGSDANGTEREWAPEGVGIITTWKDFENHRWPKPEEINYQDFEEANKYLPEGMKIVARRGHVFTEVWELMGFETFAVAVYEQPDLVEAIFEKVGSIVCKAIDEMLSLPNVGALRFNDDLAYKKTLLMNPQIYRKFFFPWLRKAVEICHKHDMPCIYHSDGNITKILDDLVEIGIDGLNPIDPTGLDIREVRRHLGTKVALLGNICQTYPLGFGTPEEVRFDALSLLHDIAPGGAYVLGSGHSVQDYVSLPNFQAMVDAVDEYGRYPIDIPDKVLEEAEAAAKASHRDVLPELEQVSAGIEEKQAST